MISPDSRIWMPRRPRFVSLALAAALVAPPLAALGWLVPFPFGAPDLRFWGQELFQGNLPFYFSLYPGALALALFLSGLFFARIYRRTGRMTWIEFFECRYGRIAGLFGALADIAQFLTTAIEIYKIVTLSKFCNTPTLIFASLCIFSFDFPEFCKIVRTFQQI